jgi:hypothetical protein
MPPNTFKRVPSATWYTVDLHEQWSKQTKPGAFLSATGSLHIFLQYCCLLKEIRQQFEFDDAITRYDECLFFLRGGYFAFAYLNVSSSMALRASIFGGLNHGIYPKRELSRFINTLQTKPTRKGLARTGLLIVDEVKSGTGMGTIFSTIKKAMNDASSPCRRDIRISFYAIRPGRTDQMTTELQKTVTKWSGQHQTKSGMLEIQVRHFAGPMLGYDSDLLCGVRRLSKSSDDKEAYELKRVSEGTVSLYCDYTGQTIFNAAIGGNCLVEFLSSCAVDWTSKPFGALSKNIVNQIHINGCFVCKDLCLKVLL